MRTGEQIDHAVEQAVGVVTEALSEPLFLQASSLVGQEDAVLDHWIASLTADEFERILTRLARVRDGMSGLLMLSWLGTELEPAE
jgi:hypothetical protein